MDGVYIFKFSQVIRVSDTTAETVQDDNHGYEYIIRYHVLLFQNS